MHTNFFQTLRLDPDQIPDNTFPNPLCQTPPMTVQINCATQWSMTWRKSLRFRPHGIGGKLSAFLHHGSPSLVLVECHRSI